MFVLKVSVIQMIFEHHKSSIPKFFIIVNSLPAHTDLNGYYAPKNIFKIVSIFIYNFK